MFNYSNTDLYAGAGTLKNSYQYLKHVQTIRLKGTTFNMLELRFQRRPYKRAAQAAVTI